MEHSCVDLSPLDPARQPLAWERRIQTTAARAWAAHQRRLTVGQQLALWARPTIAIAASIALLSWASAAIGTSLGSEETPNLQEISHAFSQWEHSGQLPETTRLMQIVGRPNGQE